MQAEFTQRALLCEMSKVEIGLTFFRPTTRRKGSPSLPDALTAPRSLATSASLPRVWNLPLDYLSHSSTKSLTEVVLPRRYY